MRSGAFQAGALLAVLIMATFVALEGGEIGRELGLVEGEPVLVFVIPVPEHARRVRAAVSPDRILWEGDAGFALVGERVITPSLERAGEVIKGAGWVDRPIRIVTLEADPDEEGGDAEAGRPASREARLARLRELVRKPTLTRGEQMFVLAAMNDGIEL
ncbi:MAG TPA: hypothetical protein ENI85_16065 [Deltaproteobacteria bacterium]|nr:hypothetical protein [Deltaproteobacteria bacterium]